MGVSIDITGRTPENDGEVHVFSSEEAQKNSWFNKGQKVIFVNGMMNKGSEHVESASALSLMLACPVTGVYNKTDGFWADLGQCITDKIKFDAALSASIPVLNNQIISFDGWNSLIDALMVAAKKTAPQLTRVALVRSLISKNPATVALYDLLQMPGYINPSVPIFAHSQGNLITSNALTALALAKGMIAVEGRIVQSYGSPCRFWPSRISRMNHAFTFDPVSWLDLRFDWNSSKVGFIAAHSFLTYMKHDPEFVINRFRTGGYGMTFNMNEEALATALVGMGTNADRVYGVFERLYFKHSNDSDDVACYYMRKSQSLAGQSKLRTLMKAKPDLKKLLLKIFDEGWTSDEEQKYIDQLKAM